MKVRNYLSGLLILTVLLNLMFLGCKKDQDDETNIGYVNITINPNSTEYIELNTVSGWIYLLANPPSRGLIVYRLYQDEFMAYERTPTLHPDQCCDGAICTKLIVDFPFVNDTCTESEFLIIDGSPISGPSYKSLYKYRTFYDGTLLRITN